MLKYFVNLFPTLRAKKKTNAISEHVIIDSFSANLFSTIKKKKMTKYMSMLQLFLLHKTMHNCAQIHAYIKWMLKTKHFCHIIWESSILNISFLNRLYCKDIQMMTNLSSCFSHPLFDSSTDQVVVVDGFSITAQLPLFLWWTTHILPHTARLD